jgi:hypothetical protein
VQKRETGGGTKRAGKDKTVRKPVVSVGELWITFRVLPEPAVIHKQHRNNQLLNTLSSEVKSRVSSLLVDFNSAILRQACNTVV